MYLYTILKHSICQLNIRRHYFLVLNYALYIVSWKLGYATNLDPFQIHAMKQRLLNMSITRKIVNYLHKIV